MYLVGDELTVTGLQLAGMKKVKKADENNVGLILKEVSEGDEIILVTQSLAGHAEREIELMRRKGVIVIEIPDKSGTGGEDVTQRLVREAVGFDLKT